MINFNPARILITGNMGYVGPGVVRQLRQTFPKAELIGYDIGFFAHCLTGAVRLPEVLLDRQVFGDIRNLPAGLLVGVDAVVNLAAISNDPMGYAFEQATMEVNHQAGIWLARRAKAAGVKAFVFASSCSMYGAGDDAPRTECATLNPLTAYARSKVLTEQDLKPLADNDFTVTSLRFATACGWSDRLRLDLVVNDFVASAVASGQITILSDGTPWRPLIHVQDMARAIEWAVQRPAANGGHYVAVNVGADEWNYQVSELAEAVARAVPHTEVNLNAAAPPDKRSYRVDFSLYRELAPHHQPQRHLADTIAELRDNLTAMNFHDANFRASTFMRLRVLTALRESHALTDDLSWAKPEPVGRSTAAEAVPAGYAAELAAAPVA
ncbi:SDR family oxidoreductase [Hymenobacter busanensis]|uniref:SDR family oxidoreductase n=1 Tax=Hymenobacter busanensis TaxID=2607656 RepID=A0A7L4ZVX4_9BACT|nr:SDR family oxidoreductase [Hymenobacter busanensis]KAA9339242.1 SDR family oxidoreductase [Hymenobacter busanensis]QHJ06996.1 NAD-dependent epimerase/dehydratase family protein [Hymenobacter busanensis]